MRVTLSLKVQSCELKNYIELISLTQLYMLKVSHSYYLWFWSYFLQCYNVMELKWDFQVNEMG